MHSPSCLVNYAMADACSMLIISICSIRYSLIKELIVSTYLLSVDCKERRRSSDKDLYNDLHMYKVNIYMKLYFGYR